MKETTEQWLDAICLKCPLLYCDEENPGCQRMQVLRAKWRTDYRVKHPEVKRRGRPRKPRAAMVVRLRGRPRIHPIRQPVADIKGDMLAILKQLGISDRTNERPPLGNQQTM